MKEDISDKQLLAAYSEAAARDIATKPNPDKAWENIQKRIAKGEMELEEPRSRLHIAIPLWIAAAVAVAFFTFMVLRLPQAEESTNESPLAFVARTTNEHVIVGESASPDQPLDSNAIIRKGIRMSAKEADFRYVKSDDVTSTTVTIPRGKLYKVMLSDSSEVWLNADSRLTFPSHFVGNKREVILEGEAYFKVVRNVNAPFIVRCGNIETHVLGTEFNIRNYNNTPEVALVTGKVSVCLDDGNKVVLSPGEAALVCNNDIQTRTIDTDFYRRWKEGLFYFDNATLLDVVCEIGRWYNIDVEIADAELNDYRLHFAADRNDSLSQIIADLNFLSYLHITKNGKKITIHKKK